MSPWVVTSDLPLGYRHENFRLAATVLNVNEGGTLSDDSRGLSVETDRDHRISATYEYEF